MGILSRGPGGTGLGERREPGEAGRAPQACSPQLSHLPGLSGGTANYLAGDMREGMIARSQPSAAELQVSNFTSSEYFKQKLLYGRNPLPVERLGRKRTLMSWIVSSLRVLVEPANCEGSAERPVSLKWLMRPSVIHARRYTPAAVGGWAGRRREMHQFAALPAVR